MPKPPPLAAVVYSGFDKRGFGVKLNVFFILHPIGGVGCDVIIVTFVIWLVTTHCLIKKVTLISIVAS
jgi:hypothetical protein